MMKYFTLMDKIMWYTSTFEFYGKLNSQWEFSWKKMKLFVSI